MSKRHVTKREAKAVVEYAGQVAAALRMPGWQIVLMSEPAEDGQSAEIQRVQGRWSARLWLSADWMTYDEDERRDTITHEVCHLLHAGVSAVVIDDAEPFMHEHEHDDWMRRVKREFELMVDHLAGFLADTHNLKRGVGHRARPDPDHRREGLMTCTNCHATTSNGLALCELCQTAAAKCLEFLPVYYRNLARWRPGRAGSRPVPGSRVLYDGTVTGAGTGDRISDTLDDALRMLLFWAQALVNDRPHLARLLTRLHAARAAGTLTDAESAAWLCRGFDRWLTSVSATVWAAAFLTALRNYEERLRELTETLVPGWYAGACKRCTAATYVVPGLTWVTCDGCGTTTYARDHLDLVLDEAADWVARPRQIAGTLVALMDTEQSVPRLDARIRQWSTRERLTPVRRLDDDGDEVGPKRYRLGDVVALLVREGQTRTRTTRPPRQRVRAS